MADQQPPQTVNAAFPAPPDFYKHFTAANLALLESTESDRTAQSSLLNDHPEIRYLRPPTPPANGEYRSFGEQRSVSLHQAKVSSEPSSK